MQDLWGEEIPPQPAKRTTPAKKGLVTIPLTAQDCLVFGHSWISSGMSQEKLCRVCGIRGYCPGCTPVAPNQAQPFFCTRHTPEGRVQA